MTQRMKHSDLTLSVDWFAKGPNDAPKRNSLPKAVRLAAKLAEDEQKIPVSSNTSFGGGKKSVVMHTDSNAIDLRGAVFWKQENCRWTFSVKIWILGLFSCCSGMGNLRYRKRRWGNGWEIRGILWRKFPLRHNKMVATRTRWFISNRRFKEWFGNNSVEEVILKLPITEHVPGTVTSW